jgi:hypothetical protein
MLLRGPGEPRPHHKRKDDDFSVASPFGTSQGRGHDQGRHRDHRAEARNPRLTGALLMTLDEGTLITPPALDDPASGT